MKKLFSLITVTAMLASIFSMFSVASATAPDVYAPTEYAINDFESASELSEFTVSDSGTGWSVTDGKLVYAATEASNNHTFAKSVNIPAGKSFALEFTTENIYSNSQLSVYLNNDRYIIIRTNGITDGNWLILFDRVNNIKIYRNGTLLTTNSSESTYIQSMADMPFFAITNLKIGFQGRTGMNTTIDYFYAYSIGDVKTYENDYDDSYTVTDKNFWYTRAQSRISTSISNGILTITKDTAGGEGVLLTQQIDVEHPRAVDVIVNFKETAGTGYKNLSVARNGSWTVKTGNAASNVGEFVAILNGSTRMASLYKNNSSTGEVRTNVSGKSFEDNDLAQISLDFTLDGAGYYVSIDYFNVYIQGMKADASDVTVEGLKLHSNMPLDLTNSTFSVGGNACTVTKSEDGLMTYDVAFASALDFETSYSLSASFATLTGRSYSDTISFTTPACVYEEPTEYFGSDFDDNDDLDYFDTNDSLVNYSIAAGKLENGRLNVQNASGSTRGPRISKTCNILSSESFVVLFDLGSVYQYANTHIQFNDTDVLWISANGSGASGGNYMLIVDRANGMKLYRNGTEVTDSTTPRLVEKSGFTSLLNSNIAKIGIQLEINNGRTTSLSYFKAYSMPKYFACAVKEDAYTSHVLLKTTHPLDIANTTATVGGAAATITAVEGEYCKYNVEFASPLTAGQSYDLVVAATSYTGETASATLPFTVTASEVMKNAEIQILNTSGEEISSMSDVIGGKIIAKLNLFANDDEDYTVHVAIHNSDFSQMLQYNGKSKSIAANKNQTVEVTADVPLEAVGQNVKFSVYVWRTDNYKALLEPKASVPLH